ncbi:MAG: hypothetical protein A2Y59_06695 [Chloroflexi bacterium RBG_13_52_14]|nr:MAG: hypothetical protein A2Y59_06695 [Chloroflexi bacterium RBG_13_52_14]
MPNLSFGLEGKEQCQEKLKPDTIKKPMAETIKKAITFLDRSVKTSTPVDTARLRSSITSKVIGESGSVFTNIEYAPYVEYGTKKMEARHVVEGASARVLGKGPFTYALELLQNKMGELLDGLGAAIQSRFG